MERGFSTGQVARYADMFAAMGAEPRLRIMQLLLTAHPQGLVVGDIQDKLGIPASTLSHHLDKLKNEELVRVRREGTFLWYAANADTLQELIGFLYAECCTRSKAVEPELITICAPRLKLPKGKGNGNREHQGSREREIRAGSLAGSHRR